MTKINIHYCNLTNTFQSTLLNTSGLFPVRGNNYDDHALDIVNKKINRLSESVSQIIKIIPRPFRLLNNIE